MDSKAENDRRATRARKAVDAYWGNGNGLPDWECCVRDLLADLRHLCARKKIRFAAEVAASARDYEAESGGEA